MLTTQELVDRLQAQVGTWSTPVKFEFNGAELEIETDVLFHTPDTHVVIFLKEKEQ